MKPLLSWLIIIGFILSIQVLAAWLASGATICGKTIPQLWDIFKLGTDNWWRRGELHTIGYITAHFILVTWLIAWMLVYKLLLFWVKHRKDK